MADAHPVELQRWYVLAIYSYISAQQSLVWMTYSSVEPKVAIGFLAAGGSDVTQATLDQLLDWGPIFFLVALPAAVLLLQLPGSGGLRNSILVAAWLCFVGALLRCLPLIVPSVGIWPVHVGQMLNAAAAPFVVASPAFLALLWFPASERNAATAIANIANAAGRAVGYFLGPAIVFSTIYSAEAKSEMATLLWVELGVTAVPVLSALIHLPREPLEAPSVAASDEKQRRALADTAPTRDERSARASAAGVSGVWALDDVPAPDAKAAPPACYGCLMIAAQPFIAVGRLLCRPQAALVMLSGGLQMAAYGAWSGVLPGVLMTSRADGGGGLSPASAGVVGTANTIAGVLGGLLTGILTDRKSFSQRLRSVMICLCLASAGVFAFAALCAPPLSEPGSPGAFTQSWPNQPWPLIALCTVAGLLRGGTDPLFFEFAAEAAYPAPTGEAGGALTLFYHGLLSVMLALPPSWLQVGAFPGMAVSMLAAGLLLLPVAGLYPRRRMDEQGAKTPGGGNAYGEMLLADSHESAGAFGSVQ
jgi:MFS family permease